MDMEENLGESSSNDSVSDSPSQSTEAATSDSVSTSPDGQLVNIDTPDRYRYKGRNLNEWESGYMRQQDYTSKTQALAQERRFVDNLSHDLERVRSNPQMAEQFRSIYPEKYHGYLRYVLENSNQNPQQQQQTREGSSQSQYARLDPAMEMRVNQLEAGFREREVAAISAELDSKFASLATKYPFADEEAVVARAQALLSKMKENDPLNQNLKISDKQWDALWKGQNDRAYGLSDTQYKKKVDSQIKANRKGSDTGKGGGLPGQAPRQYKTIKEATNAALADIEAGTF